MTHPGIAFVLIGVTIGAVLYYMFANNEQERAQSHQHQNYSGSRYAEPSYNSYSEIQGSGTSRCLDDCTICLNPLSTGRLTFLTCKHVFHRECIEDWRYIAGQRSCPICRRLFA